MDIERMKKFLTSGIEAGNKVKAVREVVKTYKTQKQDMYDDTAEILKPSIEVQKKVKKTIDNKQDELITQLAINDEIANIKQNEIIKKQDKAIKQLKDNQEELTQSIGALSEIMSNQGSVLEVGKWLAGLPPNLDQMDAIKEEGAEGEEEGAEGEEGGAEGEEGGAEGEEGGAEIGVKFSSKDIEILKKYNLDPKFEKIPTKNEMKSAFAKTTGKKNSKDRITRNTAHKESLTLSKYNNYLKKLQSGEGVRRYNQPKRNAYKISQRGQYGGLVIDLPKLHGHLKVVAHKNGQKV